MLCRKKRSASMNRTAKTTPATPAARGVVRLRSAALSNVGVVSDGSPKAIAAPSGRSPRPPEHLAARSPAPLFPTRYPSRRAPKLSLTRRHPYPLVDGLVQQGLVAFQSRPAVLRHDLEDVFGQAERRRVTCGDPAPNFLIKVSSRPELPQADTHHLRRHRLHRAGAPCRRWLLNRGRRVHRLVVRPDRRPRQHSAVADGSEGWRRDGAATRPPSCRVAYVRDRLSASRSCWRFVPRFCTTSETTVMR